MDIIKKLYTHLKLMLIIFFTFNVILTLYSEVLSDYDKIIMKAVDRSLSIYLTALEDKEETAAFEKAPYLRIGQLAKQVQETNSTIRYWTKEGLIQIADKTPAGYQLYFIETIERIKRIKALKAQRYTLGEIKDILDTE